METLMETETDHAHLHDIVATWSLIYMTIVYYYKIHSLPAALDITFILIFALIHIKQFNITSKRTLS
jgi:hypothetical protein